jgi:hypothetical protein
MNSAMLRWRSRLWWLLPVLALGVLLGIELGWGSQVHRLPEPGAALEARAVTPALLPEYKIEGGLAGRAETVSRTLFNPTRRPAPAAVADAGKSQIQRGQFVLTGTSLAGERNIAFLKEVAGGKSRTVRQGEQINGMVVAEVKPDRVRFTLGGDSEELMLKVAAGPKATAPPTAPAVPNAAAAAQPDQPRVGGEQQRRRQAQAAAAAAGQASPPVAPIPVGGAPASPAPPAPGQAPATSSTDAAWNDVYERMRQRAQPSK